MTLAVERIRAANEVLVVQRELDAISDFFSPGYLVHTTDRDLVGGHGLVRRVLDMLHGAFADIRLDVDILVEGSERVAWQRTFRARHVGSYQGFPATKRELIWRDMVTSRFDDAGLIAEEWVISDLAERLLRARKG